MTGVIYIAIIALWAAVLIPLWLRRHDQISEVRSTARFHSAMRTLSNSRSHQAGGLAFAGEAGAMDDIDFDTYDYRSADERLRAADLDYARHAAATRRAIVLGTLSAVLIVTLLLAFVGVLPKWVPAIALVPVVGFLIATSMTASARAEQSAPRQRRGDSARSARPSARREFAREDYDYTSAAPAADSMVRTGPARATATAMSDDDWVNWNAWDDDDAWDAVPTTLPTYVTAPRASQVPRRIDRSRPGEWTGTAMVETAQAMRTRPAGGGSVDSGAATAEIPVVQAPVARAVNE